MSGELLHLRHGDSAAVHELFHDFIPLTFRSVDFRLWQSRGGWNDSYEVFLLCDGGEIVASTGCSRMQLCVGGRECTGWQLGAVAVHPQRRGRGHARALLQQALAYIDAQQAPDRVDAQQPLERIAMQQPLGNIAVQQPPIHVATQQVPGRIATQQAPVLLFANDSVLDFYPRFGFRPLAQRRYVADVDWQPAATTPELCDISEPAARERLRTLCEDALPNDTLFGARRYYGVLLWHLCYRPLRACWLDEGNALAVVEESEGVLYVHDLLARRRFDLAAGLATLAQSAVTLLEFGFRPQAWWPAAKDIALCEDAPLFVRSLDELNATDGLRFPNLAQT